VEKKMPEQYWVNKKTLWDRYFRNKTLLMRIFLEMERKLLAPKFAELLKPYLKGGDRILDAGCGPALGTLFLETLADVEAYGLDISREALDEASRMASKYGCSLKRILADVRKMPFRNQSFNVVWNQGVLEHFEDPIAVISEMARVGRIVFIAVPRKAPFRALIQRVKASLGLAANDTFYLYSRDDLVGLISQAGLLGLKDSGDFNALFLSWTWALGISNVNKQEDRI